VNVKNKKSSI